MKSFKPLFVNKNLRCPIWSPLAKLALLSILLLPGSAVAQQAGVDPQVEKQLKTTLDYLGNLKQFSVDIDSTLEDVLDYGQKVQFDFVANLTVQRPDKFLAERRGEIVDQALYYDGNIVILHDALLDYYAVAQLTGNINQMLDFVRGSLGLLAPASDLLYTDIFPLMIENVYLASKIGQAEIDGALCTHYVFSRPTVDFQIWIAEDGPPLPCKYVVTDKLSLGQPSVTVEMSNWNLSPEIGDSTFSFEAPGSAKKTEFMQLDSSGTFTQQGQPE